MIISQPFGIQLFFFPELPSKGKNKKPYKARTRLNLVLILAVQSLQILIIGLPII